ncbi:sesquipedalian-1-like [Neosynchiropus ocellatus]
MKIHGKILSYFESCDSPVDKEGYLHKKGEIKTSYQKRWFLLKGNLLFYKDRPTDRDLVGVIVLEGCTVQLCESDEQFAFSLVWSEPGLRTYKFAAEDQESQENWIKALLSANHRYLSLLVMDLEKKYLEALGPSSNVVPPYFNPTESTFQLAPQSSSTSTFPGSGLSGAGLSPNLMLPAPAISPKSAVKRSPKLWPKRTANVVPLNSQTPPMGEWPGVREEFIQLHEDFGKEVKSLIADWARKRGVGDAQQNLIDFG